MKQWQLGRQPGWNNLQLVECPEPSPGPGEVLVRLRAASLNYRDLIVANEQERFTPDRVPLSDGAGEVAAVGAGVAQWKVGDRVAGQGHAGTVKDVDGVRVMVRIEGTDGRPAWWRVFHANDLTVVERGES